VKLECVYVRFFRSFNFDYERKAHQEAKQQGWEQTEQGWYPFIHLDIDPRITAVVGANESGKSHLLDAVQKLLTDERVDRQDFCRYSDLYSVEQGGRRVSDFAGKFRTETDEDRALMAALGYSGGEELFYVRSGNGSSFVFTNDAPEQCPLTSGHETALRASFSQVFRLETEVALPASMTIRRLADQATDRFPDRAGRRHILESLPDYNVAESEVSRWWPAVRDYVRPTSVAAGTAGISDIEFDLGRRLLIDVARIDPVSFRDLDDALAAEREGEVNALIQKMNDAIARHLNFPKWWAQDRDFRLLLSPREHEVAFTVRDRTGTEYSFTERSRGLRYFLSYYVQLRANKPPHGRKQLLLLDEPDAYLSGVGQQDLLRILEEFAKPEDGSDGGQVIYVTHSPYLINRNAAHRIRVLDKGSHDEGTRVVTDASRNHYEPLRSSLGPFVAETAFIGGANLFVEGLADQVLLAGISSHLRSRDVAPSRTLNLNEVTIVAAGSASAIPYMVYLARGRDVVKPPCVVLLDGDKSGRDAARQLGKNPAGRRAYVSGEFIMSVDEWAKTLQVSVETGVTVEEPEDLIALPVAAAAARHYAEVVLGMQDAQTARLTTDSIRNCLADQSSVWDATTKAFSQVFPDEHIEKVGFAREVVRILEIASKATADDQLANAVETTQDNFAHLLGHLADLLRDARAAEDDAQQRDRVARLVRGFLHDYPDGVTRDQARILFREIEKALEDTDEGDARRTALARLRRQYELESEPLEQVPDYGHFKDELSGLRLQERLAHQDRQQESALLIEPASDSTPTSKHVPGGLPQVVLPAPPARPTALSTSGTV
jgi:predicted ATPase